MNSAEKNVRDLLEQVELEGMFKELKNRYFFINEMGCQNFVKLMLKQNGRESVISLLQIAESLEDIAGVLNAIYANCEEDQDEYDMMMFDLTNVCFKLSLKYYSLAIKSCHHLNSNKAIIHTNRAYYFMKETLRLSASTLHKKFEV